MYIHICCLLYLPLTGGYIENEVFKKFYSQLVSLLPTTNISHQLVSAKVITTDDIEEITAITRSKEKASYVLRIVARSLEADITSSFYALLNIMENFGGDVSALASNIRTALTDFSGSFLSFLYIYIYIYIYACIHTYVHACINSNPLCSYI